MPPLFSSVSISLNFRSNSLRSFFSSAILLLGVGQNLRPSFSISVSFFDKVYVDRLMILGLIFSNLELLSRGGFLKNGRGCLFPCFERLRFLG